VHVLAPYRLTLEEDDEDLEVNKKYLKVAVLGSFLTTLGLAYMNCSDVRLTGNPKTPPVPSVTSPSVTTPVIPAPTIRVPYKVYQGRSSMCVLYNDRTLYCNGYNGYGELGTGAKTDACVGTQTGGYTDPVSSSCFNPSQPKRAVAVEQALGLEQTLL